MTEKTVIRGTTATVELTEGVTAVKFQHSYPYFSVSNMSESTVYVSKFDDCTANADGVAAIPSGGSATLNIDADIIYISGYGTVQITAKYDGLVSSSASAGGSGGHETDDLPDSAIDDLF